MKFKFILKSVKFIAMPLLIGIGSGIAGGITVVVLGKIFLINYTSRQQAWAFGGFIIMGVLFGIGDSINNLNAWLQHRKSMTKPPTHMDST